MTRLLEGIRVLDFGRFIAGPYCGMLLADFGADVIRIERRTGGEDRRVGPVSQSGEGGLYLNLNRNKRSLTFDPAHPRAAQVLDRLVRGADIAIVNLPLEVMQKLRLDYDSLRTTKKDIILVMASAFGPDGPYRDRVGFDAVVQAMSGAMALTGLPDDPRRSVVAWADFGTALHAAFGAMAALYHRQQTGQGQLIDVSLLATSIMFMAPLLMEHAVTGIRRAGQGNTGYYTAPSDAYRTRDGWIMVPTISDVMFRRWARLVGREGLLADPRCADDITRGNNAELINEAMRVWCADRSRSEAIAQLEQARVPCSPVYEPAEAVKDEQVLARRLFENTTFPGHAGSIPLSNPAVRLSETPGEIRHRAPTLGEHTDEILAELGFTPDEIAAFRSEGVV